MRLLAKYRKKLHYSIYFLILFGIMFIASYLMNDSPLRYGQMGECHTGAFLDAAFSSTRAFDLSNYFLNAQILDSLLSYLVLKPISIINGVSNLSLRLTATFISSLSLLSLFVLFFSLIVKIKNKSYGTLPVTEIGQRDNIWAKDQWWLLCFTVLILLIAPLEFHLASVSTLQPYNSFLLFTALFFYYYAKSKSLTGNIKHRLAMFLTLAVFFYFGRLYIVLIVAYFIADFTRMIKVRKLTYADMLSYLLFFMVLFLLSLTEITMPFVKWIMDLAHEFEFSKNSLSRISKMILIANPVLLVLFSLLNIVVIVSNLRNRISRIHYLLGLYHLTLLLYLLFFSKRLNESFIFFLYPFLILIFVDWVLSFSKFRTYISFFIKHKYSNYVLLGIILLALMLVTKPTNMLATVSHNFRESNFMPVCYHEVSSRAIRSQKYKHDSNILDFSFQCKKLQGDYRQQCLQGVTTAIPTNILYKRSFWKNVDSLSDKELDALSFGLGIRAFLRSEVIQLEKLAFVKFSPRYIRTGTIQECLKPLYLSLYTFDLNSSLESWTISPKQSCGFEKVEWSHYVELTHTKFQKKFIVSKAYLKSFYKNSTPYCESIIKSCIRIK